MSKNVTIILSDPIDSHEGPVKQLVYRPPKMREIMTAGVPYSIHKSKDGEPFLVEDDEALTFYAQACLVHPQEYSLVEAQIGVADTLQIRETLRDFFLHAESANAASKTLSRGSSSGSAGKQSSSAP